MYNTSHQSRIFRTSGSSNRRFKPVYFKCPDFSWSSPPPPPVVADLPDRQFR